MAVKTTTSRVGGDPTLSSWHRWFRRTNVHTAEYIIMLGLFAIMLGLLVNQWFGFFGLLADSDYSVRSLARSTGTSLAALLVVVPAAFWMYTRVTGQEAVEPELQRSKPRTVFLTFWMIGAVLALVSLIVGIARVFVNAIFGFNDNLSDQFLEQVLPAVFAVATVGFGISAIVKHVSRGFVKRAAVVVAAMAGLLLLANTIMVFVRKEAGDEPRRCSFSAYRNGDCSYQEYRDSFDDEEDSGSAAGDSQLDVSELLRTLN